MPVSADNRLPPLSTIGWGAILISGLFNLILVFSPLVTRPTVLKHVQADHVTPTVTILLSPVLPLAFAVMSLTALALSIKQGRNNYAFMSLGIALAGTALMIAGIYSAVV